MTFQGAQMDKKQKLSRSLEDYLEAIAQISKETGHARTKDIADHLQIKMPSVTAALRALSDTGLIVYNSHCPVELTAKGMVAAREIINRHQVLHTFLHEVLWLNQKKADEMACKIEHIVDDDTLRRIALLNLMLQEDRSDTAGFRSALSEGLTLLSETTGKDVRPLSAVPIDTPMKVVGGKGNSIGLDRDACVTVQARSLDGKLIRVAVDGKEINIPVRTAEKIWVACG